MKSISLIDIFLILSLTLVGCGPTVSKVRSTEVVQFPTPLIISPSMTNISTPTTTRTVSSTVTLASTPIPTPLKTPLLDTLEPVKAGETIKMLVQEPGGCASPCFWGIVPRQTTVEEAKNIFGHFGLQMASTVFKGENFSAINYDLETGPSVEVILTIQNDIVKNIHTKINLEKQNAGLPQEKLVYSPQALIKRYGTPSRVDFVADWGPGPFFAMQMYFDTVDLIVQYAGTEVIPGQRGLSEICLQNTQFDSVWLWLGKNPEFPPGEGVSIEKVTSMNVEEFSKLLTDDSKHTCFFFDGNVMP